jgi:hypothetical protein
LPRSLLALGQPLELVLDPDWCDLIAQYLRAMNQDHGAATDDAG